MRNFLEKYNRGKDFSVTRPYVLSHVKILLKQNKGGRPFYIEQIKHFSDNSPLCMDFWRQTLNLALTKLRVDQYLQGMFPCHI